MNPFVIKIFNILSSPIGTVEEFHFAKISVLGTLTKYTYISRLSYVRRVGVTIWNH